MKVANAWKLVVAHQPHSPSATGTGGLWGRWVGVALVVLLALGVAGMVAADGPDALCQSGHACGGRIGVDTDSVRVGAGGAIAAITPTPVPANPDALCQSDTACGG